MVNIFRRKKHERLDENDKATLKSKHKIKGAGFRADAASVFEANLSTCRSGVAAMLDVELKRANSLSSITVDDSVTSTYGLEISESPCHSDENDECEDDLQASTPCLYTTPYHSGFHPAPAQQGPTPRKQSEREFREFNVRQSVPNRGLDEFLTSGRTGPSRRTNRASSGRSCASMPSSVNLPKKSLRKDSKDSTCDFEKDAGCPFEPTGWE
jgi:hypothetical protein